LRAELEGDDPEHPPRADRLARADALAAGRDEGFEGRAELLRHLDHMVVGRDTRLGVRAGSAWIVAALDIALALPDDDLVRIDGDTLVLRHGRTSLTVYAIGAPWARELASKLDDRAEVGTPLGAISVGVVPVHERTDDHPLARLERAVLAVLPQPAPGTRVVIVHRPHGGLVLEVAPHADPAVRDRWLAGLRAATAGELAGAEPPRLQIRTAERDATVGELAASCANPTAALRLDDPARRVAAGEPFKCTDR
jgi:hypothetical protein